MKTCLQLLNTKKSDAIITIAPDQTIYAALLLLAEHKIGAVLVMQDQQLVGIFSERDYAREVVLHNRSSKETAIAEVMTTRLITAHPHDLIDQCMHLMSENRIRHLPIVENGTLVGLLSLGDLVKETIRYQQELIQALEGYIKGA